MYIDTRFATSFEITLSCVLLKRCLDDIRTAIKHVHTWLSLFSAKLKCESVFENYRRQTEFKVQKMTRISKKSTCFNYLPFKLLANQIMQQQLLRGRVFDLGSKVRESSLTRGIVLCKALNPRYVEFVQSLI